jgi:hypothetical protein
LILAVVCAGESRPPLAVTSKRYIPVKRTSGQTAVVFCAREIVPLFSVVFCVFRAVHKSDFRLVVNETPNKWRPAEGHAVIDTRVLGKISMFFLHRLGEC